MSTRLRRAPSLDALSSTNLAARSTKTKTSRNERYSSDEYSGRDSSEERSGRGRRRRNKKTGRDRSVSATRPRVGIGGTGIEDHDFGRGSSGRDRPSSARTDTKPVVMRDRPQTARPSDDRRSSISSIQINKMVEGASNKLTSSNRLSGSVNYTTAAQYDVKPSGNSSGNSGATIERGRSVTRGARPYLQRSQSEVTLTPRTQLQAEDGADRFRQSLKLAAMKLQSTNHRRVNPPSNPTTPTTPSTPFGGGHPLAMFSGSPQMASKRTEVPPSPDSIRCSKTMSKLQQVLTDREKQPRPTSMIAMSDAESGTDSRPPKANGTPDRSRKAPVLAKLKMQSSTSNDRDHQPKTEPVVTNHKKIESNQPVVVKPEVTKNDLDRISDTFNSQLQKILARLDKVENENTKLTKENNFLKKEVEDVNATLKDEYERFSKEVKSLNSTVKTQNDTIHDLRTRLSLLESSQLSEKDSPSPMTVAPRKKTLDEIFDVDELEKMLDEEDDYEARKAIRSRLRSLHKAKTAEIENRQKSKNQPPLNIPTTDDEIVVEKRTRSRARVQRSMSSVASLQSSTASNDRFGDKKTDLGRVSRTPSQASLREDDFGAAESSSSPSPSESSIRARPQTAQPKSSSVSASPKTQVRPSTAKPSSISQTVETAEIVSKSSSSGKSKLYTDSGRSMTVGAISELSSTSSSKSMSKKESAIADLKRRTDQRKAELTRIQSMPNGGTSGAAAARKKFMSRLGEDNPENRKLRRSNTISGGGPTGVKSLLLKWCQVRCKDYPVEVNNYSSSWADGSAFCALTHSFFPDAFKWEDVILNTDNNDERRKNFTLAFDTALEKADAEPLIEVEDMIFMGNRPDAKCIFCYLQSLYNKLRKFEQPIEKKDLDV